VILRGNFAPSFGLKRRRFPLPRASSIRRRYSNASSGGARAGAANFNVDGARRDASGAFRRRFCVFFVAFFRGRLLFAAFAGIIVRDARDGGETFRQFDVFDRKIADAVVSRSRFRRFDVFRPGNRRRRRFAESVSPLRRFSSGKSPKPSSFRGFAFVRRFRKRCAESIFRRARGGSGVRSRSSARFASSVVDFAFSPLAFR